MDQSVCPSCWVWYPIGTPVCKPCNLRLGGDFQAAGADGVRPYAEAKPDSVVWARRALILHAGTLLALFAYASTSLPAAYRVYGPGAGAYLTHQVGGLPGGSAALVTGAAIGAAIGLAIQLLLVRWLFGRMLLLLGVGADVWFSVITAHANLSYLWTSVGMATTVIATATLAWSVARPYTR